MYISTHTSRRLEPLISRSFHPRTHSRSFSQTVLLLVALTDHHSGGLSRINMGHNDCMHDSQLTTLTMLSTHPALYCGFHMIHIRSIFGKIHSHSHTSTNSYIILYPSFRDDLMVLLLHVRALLVDLVFF